MSEHAVTREQCKNIVNDIEAALAPVLAKHGLSLELGTRHYGPTFDVKVIGNPMVNGEPVDSRSTAFTQFATIYGLETSDLGRTFVTRGKMHKIIGLNPRATRTPIITESEGKQYRWEGGAVARLLEVSA